MKAAADAAIVTAWHGEALARTKRIRPLAEYLKTETTIDPEVGADELRGMIARMAARQKGE